MPTNPHDSTPGSSVPDATIPATRDDVLNPVSLRPTVMDVDLDAIAHNYRTIQSFVGNAKVMPVIKANAYGHGLVTCARHFQEIGAPFLAVAFLEEAIELRQAGVTIPILVLGGLLNSQIHHYLHYNVDITASSVSKLDAVEEAAKALGVRARVHLKIDTGLERIGVHYYSAGALLERAIACRHVDIVGIFSHFATVREDLDFARLQLERFLEVTSFFERHSAPMPLRHIAASGALMMMKESHLDMVRPGIAVYGVTPSRAFQGILPLKQAMSLKTTIVYFKVVKAGAGVSYGLTWKAPEDTRVVTLPLGYGDGYFRRLSNRGKVLIRGKRYPIVGTICMDQLMVNIGRDEAYNGEEVVLIGEQGAEKISIEEIAELVETNTHEVLVTLNLRVNRRYHHGEGRSKSERP